jgi:hypothetical protein
MIDDLALHTLQKKRPASIHFIIVNLPSSVERVADLEAEKVC